jgi:hypothetical protein
MRFGLERFVLLTLLGSAAQRAQAGLASTFWRQLLNWNRVGQPQAKLLRDETFERANSIGTGCEEITKLFVQCD